MSVPIRLCDDPQEPSTSTASERRKEENLKRFDKIFSHELPKTLLHVCTAKQRGKLSSKFHIELRKLQGLNFTTLLKPHEAYLSDLAKISGSTFYLLCKDLRFLASFKTLPPSMSNSEHANPFFKLVANCVIYRNNSWEAVIDRRTLYDAVTAETLNEIKEGVNKLSHQEKEKVKVEEKEPPRKTRPKRGLPTEPPNDKIIEDIKKPIPLPEPYQPQRSPNFSPMIDEHLRSKHPHNSINEVDSTFCARWKTLKTQLIANNQATRRSARELSDAEYYSDDIVLLPQHISFRIEHVAQITDFPMPQVENDGYFPPNRGDREWYLYEKYNQCNQECRELFNQLRPPNGLPIKPGFRRAYPFAHELLIFHNASHHIHGFFDVWQELDRGWLARDGKWMKRRYLVDIYNHFMFPLYIDVQDWSDNLKKTFDKISFYNLKLMTVIRKHLENLKNIGNALFAPYPAHLEKHLKNIQSAKVRNAYLHQIQLENNRVVDLRCMMDLKFTPIGLEEEGKKKRRSRKSDAQSDSTTPKTSRGRAKNMSVSRAMLQKENVNKMVMMSLPSASAAGMPIQVTPGKRRRSLENPSPRRNPPSATKRRNEEMMSLEPPPAKKPAVVDSWDEDRHRAIEEEHVDEEEDLAASPLNQTVDAVVWKPQDEGLSPEEYASQILEHYGVKKGEDSESGSNNSSGVPSAEHLSGVAVPSDLPLPSSLPQGPLADLVADMSNDTYRIPPSLAPPMPVVKQRRSRKSNSRISVPESGTPMEHDDATPAVQSESLPSNGKGAANGSTGPIASKPNRTYSMKSATLNKAVFPVKKLAPSPVMNGAVSPALHPLNSAAALAMRNSYMTKRQQAPIIGPQSSEPMPMHPHQPGSIGFSKEVLAAVGQNRTPYYQTGVYPKTSFSPQPNGYDASLLQPSTSSASSSSASSSSSAIVRPPVGSSQTTPRLFPQQPRIIQPTPPHRLPFDVATPASRAINHHQQRQFDGVVDNGKCRRAMSYNDQMAYKNQRWESKKKAASVPPNAHQTPPAVQRSMSNTPLAVEPVLAHRPRSQSNNGVTIARPRQMLAIPPSSPERSVGVPNSRQTVPWIGNSSRARSTSSTRTTPQLETSGPLLPSSMTAVNVPRTTTTAYTVMDSSHTIAPTTITRTYTNYSRKTHSMTPEELGAAIRSESQRFQEEHNGEHGPTVKNFLLNLKN